MILLIKRMFQTLLQETIGKIASDPTTTPQAKIEELEYVAQALFDISASINDFLAKMQLMVEKYIDEFEHPDDDSSSSSSSSSSPSSTSSQSDESSESSSTSDSSRSSQSSASSKSSASSVSSASSKSSASSASSKSSASSASSKSSASSASSSSSRSTAGRVLKVRAGDNLQSALDAALPGDTIEIQAGAKFVGAYQVKPRVAGPPVLVTSDKWMGLPSGRVNPMHMTLMPRITAPNQFNPALTIRPGVKGWQFLGLDITTEYNALNDPQYGVVRVGYDETGSASAPDADGIGFDRCCVHGTPNGNVRDGIVTYKVRNLSINECDIRDIHAVGYESHAIHVFISKGPVDIINNFIQGAGINVFIGDSSTGGVIPQDIRVLRNTIVKPLSWKIGHPTYAGVAWTIKNLVEIKAGSRILIEDNDMAGSWVGGQHGQAIVVTPRAALISDLDILKNYMRDVENGIALASADVTLHRVKIVDNVLANTLSNAFGGCNFFLLSGAPGGAAFGDVLIEHNTILGIGTNPNSTFMFNGNGSGVGKEVSNLIVRNNVVTSGTYGVAGNGIGIGKRAADHFCNGYSFRDNVLIKPNQYFGPDALPDWVWKRVNDNAAVGFNNTAFVTRDDFKVKSTSQYAGLGIR